MASTNSKKPRKFTRYVCTLTDCQRKFVEEEFYEVYAIRKKWIKQLRQWVLTNPDIVWSRAGPMFLLRFLRYTKFARWCDTSALAQSALARYLAMRHIYPEWCRGLDPRGELMQKMIRDEVFSILGMDSAGQTIIWIRLGRFDVENLNAIVLLRYTIMFLELIADHEPVQVGGIKVLVDYEGTTWKHFLRYNLDLLSEFKKVVENVMPVWIREVHNVGLPDVAQQYRAFLCTQEMELVKYKTYWHKSAEYVKPCFEKDNWPEEYGGPCNATRQSGYLKRWFEEKRHLLLELDQMDINVGIDEMRYFKPDYNESGMLETRVRRRFELMNTSSEFGRSSVRQNVQSAAGTAKTGATKKVTNKYDKIPAKVNTNLRRK